MTQDERWTIRYEVVKSFIKTKRKRPKSASLLKS